MPRRRRRNSDPQTSQCVTRNSAVSAIFAPIGSPGRGISKRASKWPTRPGVPARSLPPVLGLTQQRETTVRPSGKRSRVKLPEPDPAAEISQLRRENDRLRTERDILKKAVAIFSEPPR
jgi:hypothetical protein